MSRTMASRYPNFVILSKRLDVTSVDILDPTANLDSVGSLRERSYLGHLVVSPLLIPFLTRIRGIGQGLLILEDVVS